MATYTSAQLKDGGALSTETFDPTSEENEVVKISILLPMITPVERNHADVGQCTLFIQTLNLGTNPTVAAREIFPPFGKNPTVDYMEAGYETEGAFKTNIITQAGSYGFFPQRPALEEFNQTITFSSLGITHNLSKIPGSVCGPGPEESVPFERVYLSQKVEGRKIAAFTFNNTNLDVIEGVTKTFYWYPSNYVPMYGDDEGTFFYGGVMFKGVGDFSLTTATIPLLGL